MRKFIAVQCSMAALLAVALGGFPPNNTAAGAGTNLVPGTVPHYYGPYPNYANSPQRLSDAVIEFDGGGGSGAAAIATVDPTTGAIQRFTLTDGGSGYTSAPTVNI
ncbi:MAG: hypothetical protein ABMA25_26285, partial [Ilumatobacteraceae bacterium]